MHPGGPVDVRTPSVTGPDYMQSWNNLMPRLKKWNVKVVRLAARFPDAPFTYTGWSMNSVLDYAKLENVVSLLDANGIKVIFDFMHVTSPDYFGSEAWMNNWVDVANRYKNDTRVVAFEIYNEPSRETWTPEIRAKTTYPSPYTDIQRALAVCTDRIRATGDNHTIIWPDHMNYQNYNYVYYDHANLRPNIIQTWHCWLNQWAIDTYPPDGLGWWEAMKAHIAIFKADCPNIPIQIGEIGGMQENNALPGGPEIQKAFIVAIVNWCVANNVDVIWWLLSTNHWVAGFADDVLASTNLPAPPVTTVSSIPIWLIPAVLIGGIAAYMVLK